MKKQILSLLILGFLALVNTTYAQMGMMGNYSQNNRGVRLEDHPELVNALEEIYNTQDISDQSQIDCSKVTDDQFETLGDASMSAMLPNENQHEAMDTMMGGEGSASLRQAHINMGRAYLGCWSSYNSGPVFMPMIGGMTGSLFSYPMMWAGYGFGGMFFMVVWSALAIVGIIALIKWLISASSSKK